MRTNALKVPFTTHASLKMSLLAHEAKRWVRFVEKGGQNKGQVVEAFQKAVDGRAHGEPWCMSFVQYCLMQTDFLVDEMFAQSLGHRTIIHKTEHCMTAWKHSPIRVDVPVVGSVMIWQKGSTSAGHCGIVVGLDADDKDHVYTVEGNTGPQDVVNREGDGVFLKKRSLTSGYTMKVKGFLIPWRG